MICIEEINIKRFRSIDNLTLKIDSTHNISTICGQNNVGKTNVLRALSLFFNKLEFNFREDVPEFKQMTMGSSVYPHLTLHIKDTTSNDVYVITKDFDIRKIEDDSIKNYSIKGKKNNQNIDGQECEQILEKINIFYLPSINISFPETINYLVDDKFLSIEFGNSRMRGKKGEVKNYLERAKSTLQDILDEFTATIDPIFKDFHENWGIKFLVPKNINRFREIINEEIEFIITDDTMSEIRTKGSGLQRLGHILLNLRIIDKLVEAGQNCILIIDEPDIYLHSKLQKKLNALLIETSKKAQIFITTHSPLFINGYKMRNLFLLELAVEQSFVTRKKKEGNKLNTTLVDLTKDDAIFLIKETLGVEDSDNLTIGKRNIIVEGEEDKRYITELAKYFDLPMCNIIPAGGVTNFSKYLDFYNSIASEEFEEKPTFILLFDNDNAGRDEYGKIKFNNYPNLMIKKFYVIDSQNTDFSKAKSIKPNIEIEDLIYPEIILDLSNKIFAKKKGFKKISETAFNKKLKNPSFRHKGILDIIDDLKNERNPELGFILSTNDKSFKGGLANLFSINGDQEMIDKIKIYDTKYPEVKKFLTELMNA